MGIMDKAVTAATDADARQRAAQLNKVRQDGNALAAQATEKYGLTFEFLDRYPDNDHYVKKYRDFGGPEWKQQKNRFIWMFQVEDVQLGLIEVLGGMKPTSFNFVVRRPCPNCNLQRYMPVQYVSAYGEPDALQADLLLKLGKALTSEEPCTRCQAQPCECCGRAR